jgi:hypothetical protein
MNFDRTAFEELRSDRLAYVDGLRRNKGFEAGILKLLTQLYPDNAHFIYELLQNAEDAKASHARFRLSNDALVFEHDGARLFSARDVESLTSIGDSTKADSPTEIGKFGVGFKAVFAYTKTPEIHSGEYHFRINDLVVPELLPPSRVSADEFSTKFIFPFDHARKSAKQAAFEIAETLIALEDATLLFLSNIGRITYVLSDGSKGHLVRILPPDLQLAGSKGEQIEVSVQSPGNEPYKTDWLRYRNTVAIKDEGESKDCTVAVAFRLAEVEGANKKSRWKIATLNTGGVFIYFKADKETSNLHFHMHAPFASTVARDSVRDTVGNKQLLSALAELSAKSMEDLRDRDLLTVAALEVLPIDDDNLSDFYDTVRVCLLEAFKSQDLVPTKSGSHKKSGNLFRGPSDIVNLIDDADLNTLTGDKWAPPLWAANPPQINQRADKFLDALKIDGWEWGELCAAFNCESRTLISEEDTARPERLKIWLETKNDAWLQRLYALLHDAMTRHYNQLQVSNLSLVRVETRPGVRMVKPADAFFPPPDEALERQDVLLVRSETYSFGKSGPQKTAARSFLEKVGVRIFDEETEIKTVLDMYESETSPDQKSHMEHVRRFTAFHKAFPEKARIFRGKKIFLGQMDDSESDLELCAAKDLFLDDPFVVTGLSGIVDRSEKRGLWIGYEKLGAKKAFVDLVKALGIQTELQIEEVETGGNKNRKSLRFDYISGARWTYTAIDEDWAINNIKNFATKPTTEGSRILWNTVTKADPKVLKAKFRPNKTYPVRESNSQLICWLKDNAWIPDVNGTFRKPQDISRGTIAHGFVYDDRNGLLTAIGFEAAIQRQTEDYKRKDQAAREIGFKNLDDAVKISEAFRAFGLDTSQVVALFAQYSAKPEQPEEAVSNPGRRRKGVLEHRDNAPENEAVKRERSIQPNLTNVVAQAKAYLRAKYTNANRQMVCQVCQNEMPFKLVSGEYYFEAIQILKGLPQHYYENRLALCPTCAAMYQYAGSNNADNLRKAISSVDADQVGSKTEVSLFLAGEKRMLHFVGTHLFDLQVVLEKED